MHKHISAAHLTPHTSSSRNTVHKHISAAHLTSHTSSSRSTGGQKELEPLRMKWRDKGGVGMASASVP